MSAPLDYKPRPRERRGSARERGYTTAWDKASKAFLAENPLCRMCQEAGKIRASTVTDHITPHRGDMVLFWDKSNWQPLCKPHHDQTKQQEERRGYSGAVGLDGWPTDDRHPANRSGER